ncbi:uveal autoantigen with coiled-coil domains and ankyrin repeats, partial [Sabethes cyaneus]|uniref:uveal autoantigen with coiled-coil domains and ankyrin repeats n=1 Tax=Sabethes cyaneus TaxID=53552 RepID=UPI00237E6E09
SIAPTNISSITMRNRKISRKTTENEKCPPTCQMEAKSKPRTPVVPTPAVNPSASGVPRSAAGVVVKKKPTSLSKRPKNGSIPKHTVKFKEQSDQDILVVTVEPPSPSPPASRNPSPVTPSNQLQLPVLGTARKPTVAGVDSTANQRGGARKSSTATVLPVAGRLSEGCTTLMYACQQGLTEETVRELREKPDVVHRRDRNNRGALHYASNSKDVVAAASVAMVAPELIESADEDGFTPLHLAVIQGNLQLVNLLLANGADVNALDNEGHSVVHWATVCGEVEALRTVLSAGADVSTPDINGGSPLHYAAQMCGANYEGKTARASAKLALDILNTLLAHPDTSVEVEDKDGRQPLLWAASAGSAKAVLALIKAGAHVESADKDGLTALHCAASRGHTECIDTLINLCGAHTDQIDSNGCTALHYSVTLGHADATSLLLKLEADPNRQDRKGRTPAHCGCAKGQMETVKILYTKKGNLWLRNAKGDFPVHDAASSGRRQLVQWLLQMKPKHINTPSNDGRTLLHIAAGHDNVDLCKLLLELGAEMNNLYRPNSKSPPLTPLDYALAKGFRSTAKFLQMQGGLPANKLRLSGRQQKILPDIDKVEPLKLTEKEELIDLKTSKRYIVYLNSNSESDSQDDRSHRKSRHKRKGSHRARRTSSCSDSVYLYREGAADISRSRSNAELHRSHRHHHSRHHRASSSASSSTSETSSDECCKHVKRKHKCYKKCSSKSAHAKDRSHREREARELKEYEFMYAEKREAGPRKPGERCGRIVLKQVHSGSSENDSIPENGLGSTARLTRNGKPSLLSVPTERLGAAGLGASGAMDFLEEQSLPKTPPKAEFNIRKESDAKSSDSGGKKSAKKVKGNGKKAKAHGKTHGKKIDSHSDEEGKVLQQHGEKVVTEAQVHPTPDSMAKSTEDDGAATDATYTIEQKTKSDYEGLSESEAAEKVKGVGKLKSKVEAETIVEAKDETALETTEVQEELAALKKERTKLKSTKDSKSSKSKSDSSDKEVLKGKPMEVVHVPPSPPPPPEPTPEPVVIEMEQQVPPEPTVVVEPTAEPTILPDEAIVPQEPAPPEVQQSVPESVEPLPADTPEQPVKPSEEDQRAPATPETSKQTENQDQVLPTDVVAVDEESKKKVSFDKERPKLKRSEESMVEHVEEEEVRTEEEAVVPLAAAAAIDQQKVDMTRSFFVNLDGETKEATEEADDKKKRPKPRKKIRSKDTEEEAQSSKDQDSGFEPSPQSIRSKPTVFERPTSTAVLPRRQAFTMVEERAVSSRPEGRKPGDRNAVNMTTVQQSIQRNIRRYYMERKIFQHLLELKSLQIRSTKVNESALVKRAVDDYHKSTIELGYETGSTLKRYPYSEYSFKNFELFLYDTLKSLQKRETYNFQNISEVYDEAERRLSPDVSRYERALNCTTKTHRCLHATHAYTGIPCAAYIPMMNHHTIPKLGFGPYKSSSSGVGSFFLPKILTNPTDRNCPAASALAGMGGTANSKVALELTHGSNKQVITLPSEKLDSNKRYYVTFTLKPPGITDAQTPAAAAALDSTDQSLLSNTGKPAESQPRSAAESDGQRWHNSSSIGSFNDAQHPDQRQPQPQPAAGVLPAVVEEDSNLDSSSQQDHSSSGNGGCGAASPRSAT